MNSNYDALAGGVSAWGLGKLGTRGGMGSLGALGTGNNRGTLEAPTLAMDPAWTSADATPDFLLSWATFNILTGDIITTQVESGTGGNWSSLEINSNHTVTAAEQSAGFVALGLSTLADGTHEARAKVTRGTAFSNWSNTQGFTVAATDVTAPTLSSPTGAQLAQTTATIGVTTNEANGTLYYVVTTSATPPSAAQVKAGQNNGGSAALFAGSQAITTTGAKTATATGITIGTRYAYFMHEDAATNQSSVAASSSWSQADITAPVLSSPDFNSVANTTATITVSTDEGNGTLYWVASTSATPPSVAQIKAGNDSTGSAAAASGNQSVSGTGTQSANVTGLAGTTSYYGHFVHTDSATNNSNVSSTSVFTTTSAAVSRQWATIDAYINSGGARSFASSDSYIVEAT